MSEPGGRAEIVPEPSPEEREAILAALAAAVSPARDPGGDGWRRAGLPRVDDEDAR